MPDTVPAYCLLADMKTILYLRSYLPTVMEKFSISLRKAHTPYKLQNAKTMARQTVRTIRNKKHVENNNFIEKSFVLTLKNG